MNMNQIINMVIRIIMRRTINSGINKGMSAMRKSGGGKKPKAAGMSQQEQAEFEEFKRQKQLASRQGDPVDRM